MEVDGKIEMFNPWKVENIDQFLNYCCPECDTKQKTKSDFIVHAIDTHPNSREYLPLFDFEEDRDHEDDPIDFEEPYEYHSIKEEEDTEMFQAEVKLEIPEEIDKPKCEKCDKEFATKKSLSNHKSKFHPIPKAGKSSKYTFTTDPKDGIQKIKCEECETFFKSKKGMKQHMISMHSQSENMQKCFVCPAVIPSKMLTTHMLKKHRKDDGNFQCDLCSKVFKKACEPYLFHLTKEHQIGEFRHKCDECDKICDSNKSLEHHKKIHHLKSREICDKCGQEFVTQVGLRNHMKRVHHIYKITKEETIKKCDNCHIDFENPKEFNNHLKQCLDELKNFKCKFCDSHWVSHLSLCQHLAVDHKLIQYVCDICGFISVDSNQIVYHKRSVHEKQFDYVCHLCAKGYNKKQYLNSHMVTVHQIGERKFKCDQCDKSFARHSVLQTHFQSHHAKKTLYQCEQCPKTFWMKNYLSTHVRMIHENYRPNKCDICAEGFVYKRDVVSHKKHVHNIHE